MQRLLRNDIDPPPEHRLEVLHEARPVEQARSLVPIHEEVDVAAGGSFRAADRAEDSDVAEPPLLNGVKDRFPMRREDLRNPQPTPLPDGPKYGRVPESALATGADRRGERSDRTPNVRAPIASEQSSGEVGHAKELD